MSTLGVLKKKIVPKVHPITFPRKLDFIVELNLSQRKQVYSASPMLLCTEILVKSFSNVLNRMPF